MASSLAVGRCAMSWGPFFRGFRCAGGVDSGFGEMEGDVEALGWDFVGGGSSGLGERGMCVGVGSSSSIFVSSIGVGDGCPSSEETGRSRILTGSVSTHNFDGEVEE